MSNKRSGSATSSARCRTCQHPDRVKFDRALALKKANFAQVAAVVDVHRSSVKRHFENHVEPDLAERIQSDPDISSAWIVFEMKQGYADLGELADEASAAGDTRAALAAQKEKHRVLEAFIRLDEKTKKEVEELSFDPVKKKVDAEEVHARIMRRFEAMSQRKPGFEAFLAGSDDEAGELSDDPGSEVEANVKMVGQGIDPKLSKDLRHTPETTQFYDTELQQERRGEIPPSEPLATFDRHPLEGDEYVQKSKSDTPSGR